MSKRCIKAFISGRVQGVFFRQSTQQQAQQLAITGHAINLRDGRVEVIACGESWAVEQLLKWLHKGPQMAQVEQLQFEDIQITVPASFTTG